MRIGLFGARADNTGLGTQTWEFFRHIKPDKTVVIDVSDRNPEREQSFDRFPGATIVRGTPEPDVIVQFLKDLDVVFCMETPYNYDLFNYARAMGVKTILQFNFEFLEYLQDTNLPVPDLFAAPSMWHYNDVPFLNKTFLPVPVDRERLPGQRKLKVKTILHNAGQNLLDDRNGTNIFLESLPLLSPELKVIIYSQHKLEMPKTNKPIQCKVEIRDKDIHNYWEIYKEGDLLVLPRKFGGLCLPLNEASSRGMLVVMTDVSPQNKILPKMTLVNPSSVKEVQTKATLQSFSVSPEMLADKINHLSRCDMDIIGTLSRQSDIYANGISWKFLEPLYRKIMKMLVEGK